MILGVAISDRRRGTPAQFSAAGGPVLTAEGHRSRVVMQLIELHLELLADRHHDLGEQRGAVGIEQMIQRTAETIIAQMRLSAAARPSRPISCARRSPTTAR